MPETIDVLIIGSGPAGMSTALHLVQADPAWAERLLVIDQATHPREKLCGGGLTRPGLTVLQRLGLSIPLPQIPIHELRVILGAETYIFREQTPLFWVIRRDEFDHWLVQCGRERGITVCEGEAVIDIQPKANHLMVSTARRPIRARVVVAADGSRSFVRQKLNWGRADRMARLLEVLTPEPNSNQAAFANGVAVFDFSAIEQGLQGYYWDFPSLIGGRPVMNRGIFDSRSQPARPRVNLKQLLGRSLAQRQRNLADYPLKGHPIFWFSHKNKLARPHLILAGDAAGVDPMVGEGISFALGYGAVAAEAIRDAFADQNFSFASYRQRVLSDPLLSELRIRRGLARLVYALNNRRLIWLVWRLGGPMMRLLKWLAPQSIPFQPPVRVRDG
ncbi:MAG: FAD-dependent monooxygenase [Anaerolineae bacterium]|nr:FAD-dependent monooxygenase [Anaerolineae bacterium]